MISDQPPKRATTVDTRSSNRGGRLSEHTKVQSHTSEQSTEQHRSGTGQRAIRQRGTARNHRTEGLRPRHQLGTSSGPRVGSGREGKAVPRAAEAEATRRDEAAQRLAGERARCIISGKLCRERPFSRPRAGGPYRDGQLTCRINRILCLDSTTLARPTHRASTVSAPTRGHASSVSAQRAARRQSSS